MKDIWVISDTHFHHANILRFKDAEGNLIRGSRFSSVAEMDECMLENWNRVVKPGDKVYHLGDVQMGKHEQFRKFWPRLNGKKNLIVGNHDDIKYLAQNGFFAKIYMWRMFPEFGLLLSHVPIHETSARRYPPKDYPESVKEVVQLLNVHGHIHQNASPTPHHRCVCVEHIDYTPINIEELRIR